MPLALLLALGLVMSVVRVENPALPWWQRTPEHWIYPLQAMICGALVWYWRAHYRWGDRSGRTFFIGIVAGVVGIAFWILGPTVGEPRSGGFDPTALGEAAAPWVIGLRVVRLAIVVPFVEELFWRGYLQPTLTRTRGAAIGLVSTAVFVALAHQPSDWLIAFVYGLLAGVVYLWTKSLAACIAMHATANLILGIYILQSSRWSLW